MLLPRHLPTTVRTALSVLILLVLGHLILNVLSGQHPFSFPSSSEPLASRSRRPSLQRVKTTSSLNTAGNSWRLPFANLLPSGGSSSCRADEEALPSRYDFCPVCKADGDVLCKEYGRHTLQRSRLFEGSGERVRKVLKKAASGKPVTLAVLGGSVSACHGLKMPAPEEEVLQPFHPGSGSPGTEQHYNPYGYPSLLGKWWSDVFPNRNNRLYNAAIGATDSSYFAFCADKHVSNDVDLVVLEFDVNDYPKDLSTAQFFDMLLRLLLSMPNEPAVIVLGAFSPLWAQIVGYSTSDVFHLPPSIYYDVPYISVKTAIWDTYLKHPYDMTDAIGSIDDGVHPNRVGHEMMADVLIAYLQSQLCALERELAIAPKPAEQGPKDEFELDAPTRPDDEEDEEPFINSTLPFDSLVEVSDPKAPKMRLLRQPSRSSLPLVPMFGPLHSPNDPNPPLLTRKLDLDFVVRPYCASANDPLTPFEPLSKEGWEPYVWDGEKHYWVSDKPGSKIVAEINVAPGLGKVAVYFFRSKQYHLGNAKCWIDDNEKGAETLVGYWTKDQNLPTVGYIDEFVAPGRHTVTCELLQETANPDKSKTHFRIIAFLAS